MSEYKRNVLSLKAKNYAEAKNAIEMAKEILEERYRFQNENISFEVDVTCEGNHSEEE